MKNLLITFIFISSFACSSLAQKNKSSNVIKDYKEDFAPYRAKFESAEPKKETTEPIKTITTNSSINKLVNSKLDTLYSYNQKITSADGYRILIYNGTSSEEARTQRNNLSSIMLNDKTYTEWKSPYFKVKTGDFIDKLEAYYAFAKIIKIFPNAIVVPDKVNIIRDLK